MYTLHNVCVLQVIIWRQSKFRHMLCYRYCSAGECLTLILKATEKPMQFIVKILKDWSKMVPYFSLLFNSTMPNPWANWYYSMLRDYYFSNFLSAAYTFWPVWTNDSRLLQELNLTARQPRRAPYYVIQATSSEGLTQGPLHGGLSGVWTIDSRCKATNLPLSYHTPSADADEILIISHITHQRDQLITGAI